MRGGKEETGREYRKTPDWGQVRLLKTATNYTHTHSTNTHDYNM